LNWYKKAQLNVRVAASAQEWWIGPNGDVVEADSDSNDGAGTYGHEDRAIEEAQRIVKNKMRQHPVFAEAADIIFGEMGNYEEYDPIASREYLNNWIDHAFNMGQITEEQVDDIYDAIEKETGVSEELLTIAMGSGEDYEARDYALKNWGWIAIRGTNIETHTLSPRDVAKLTKGIQDIWGDKADNLLFDIHVRSGDKYLTRVPFNDIRRGKLSIHMRNPSGLGYT